MNKDLPSPRIPVSTYRIQFNHRFTFRDATRTISYLDQLGITDIYASPYFKAKSGSLHGYDIVDHNSLNPELGTHQDYAAMIAELHRHGMGQVLDIVPNHMYIESPDNAWWMDVLENGLCSPYAAYFDIDWAPVKKELKDKVLIPVLGGQYGNILEGQELRLAFEEGAFFVYYDKHKFPVLPETYVSILEHRLEKLKALLPEESPDLTELLSIITALQHLPPFTETDPLRITERYREKEVIKRRLRLLVASHDDIGTHITENLILFNGTKGDSKSFDLLDNLMSEQIYRLSYWRVATDEINYRRFFDINGLGAIRMEHPAVFAATHALVFRLIRERSVTGLRIDHTDGLYNPVEYFHWVQRGCFIQEMITEEDGVDRGQVKPEAISEAEREHAMQYDETVLKNPEYKPFYIVGEKILTKSERMPEDWPIYGTTGYVFLNSVNGILIAGQNAKAFNVIYEKFIRKKINMQDMIAANKKVVMRTALSSEVNTLGHYLNNISERNRHTRDFTLNSLRRAIVEVIAAFPVYRTYTNTWTVSDRDIQYIELAVSRAKRNNPAISESIFDFLKEVLLLRFPKALNDTDKAKQFDFLMRFQQFTGPVMAIGVEDTTFYVYNRLVSLNEVGGMPDRFGTTLEAFHGQNMERLKFWPHALITTDTHDTKRSDDVRARINVLSEIPREWGDHVKAWARINKKRKTKIDGVASPDRNEEYLLYQTLVGAWPIEMIEGNAYDEFVGRIRDYMIKASREAKVNTSWVNPNEAHEQALITFIDHILRPTPGNQFLTDFIPFQRKISHCGMYNSLTQTLLKICVPGVPDFYQGTELWNFNLVDPDNRRPVDYEKRIDMLSELKRRESEMIRINLAGDLSRRMDDGRIKMYLTYKALAWRKANRRLFEKGEYLPLTAVGSRTDNVCAFLRRMDNLSTIVVVPRFLWLLMPVEGSMPMDQAQWEDTYLVLPDADREAQYRNIFTDEIIRAESLQGGKQGLALSSIFSNFPMALMVNKD
jgi:(1->4)-alpha-D-glucan 1-alpha-D-glucosylmutase